MGERNPLRPGDPEYERLAREEIEHYSEIFLGQEAVPSAQTTLVQPVPPSWIEVEHRAEEIVRDVTGATLTGHVLTRLGRSERAKMLSLGCGPGGVELAFARECRTAQITGIDLNPELVSLGNQRAQAEDLNVQFEVGDLNIVDLESEAHDLVFCHASLHHVLELERLAGEIQKTLRDGGELITVDVCSRNGYLMWPETKEVVQDIFRTLPPRFRINHTAYGQPRVDDQIWEADTSSVSMECIRSEDIIGVLASNLEVEQFVPYFTISRRLVDTMYGPNYHLDQSLDTALLNWIWELDSHYLSSKQLRPETFFAIYSK